VNNITKHLIAIKNQASDIKFWLTFSSYKNESNMFLDEAVILIPLYKEFKMVAQHISQAGFIILPTKTHWSSITDHSDLMAILDLAIRYSELNIFS
jgi:hypothetical protein